MRVSFLALLCTALLVGCGERDNRTVKRTTTTTTTAPDASTTDAPRTGADRSLTTTPGAPTSSDTRAQTREAARPVLPDPGEVDRDNTRVNKRDADRELTKTPIDQNENQKDLDITAAIRKQVTDTKMSVNAQNVKVMTQDGKVTLRGPVKSDEEKQRIEKIALEVAGAGNVDNQLEVEENK
jgi:hypothetical protein